MKLYYAPGACSLSPHIALREAGLKFDLERVDLRSKKTQSGEDYLKINPKGQVPLLALGEGHSLSEGPAVVQYIADQKPEARLAPSAGTFSRYKLQEWLNFITSELHKSFSPLFSPATPDACKAMLKESLGKRFDFLDKHLAANQYLHEGRFSVADIYAFVVVGWAKPMKIDLARWPNLKAWHERISARPKVQEALQAEGLA